MPTVAAKKPTRKATPKRAAARRLPSYMKTDPQTGLAVAKARPGIRVLSSAEVRALSDV